MRRLLIVAFVLTARISWAQDLTSDLAKCRALTDSSRRLVCYDKVADQSGAKPVQAKVGPHVQRQCISSSGRSIYDLNLSLPLMNGQVRYRFMGQDILYSVTLNEVSETVIRGRAEFESSASGETRGTSFDFTYTPKSERFRELNTEATCK